MGKEDRSRKGRKTVKAVKNREWKRSGRGRNVEKRTDGDAASGNRVYWGFLFHLVWEAKGQYSVVYFMLLLPYAYLGMERVADVFLDVTGAGKE